MENEIADRAYHFVETTIGGQDGQTFGEWLAAIPVFVWIISAIIIVGIIIAVTLFFVYKQKNQQSHIVQQQVPKTKFCKYCEAAIPINAIKCDNCGAKVKKETD